jgi:hypothetical protein
MLQLIVSIWGVKRSELFRSVNNPIDCFDFVVMQRLFYICWREGRQAEQSVGFQQYGGGVKKWVETEKRSNLKEEASDLKQSEVATKDTRECV